MTVKKLGFYVIMALVIALAAIIPTQANRVYAQNPEVTIYYFWGDGCPVCNIATPQLQAIADEDPRVNIEIYEVWFNAEAQQIFVEMAADLGFQPRYVPTTIIGDRYWEGFTEDIQADIEAHIDRLLGPAEEPTEEDPARREIINLPLIGTVDLSGQSLLVSTLIISFVDGFNPCSLWVLSVLLSITLQTRSRKKVLIVGFSFLLTTALLYGLFIAGVFSVLRIISFLGWIQVVVALIALAFALVNIKDYFWFKEGISFSISDKKKPGIYQRMRGILRESDSVWKLVIATVVFAAGIALVELACTAGFPVIWSNILASQQVTTTTFVLLLLVYMLVYLLDEVGIFLVAVFTLRSTKLEEKHGRVLKLIGGVLMLTLALVMIINPNVMNDITGTLIIFAVAIGATALILLVHRVILPKFNIRIGTEY